MGEIRRREYFNGDSWRDVVLMKKRLAPRADFE